MIRRADKEHTAAGAAVCFITGNRSTIHGKGRAGLIVGALFTDLHAAGDRAAVQLKFAAVDEHSALNPAAVGAVSQRQRRAAADRDTAGNRLPVQAEVDLARWHNPVPRHRLRQIIAARRIRQGIGCIPRCDCRVMLMTVDRCAAVLAADAVARMGSSLYRRHCGIRFAVLRLAAAVGITAVRTVRHAAIFAASQPGILTGGVSAVGICGILHHACFLRQRRRGQQRQAEHQGHEQAQNSFFHKILL